MVIFTMRCDGVGRTLDRRLILRLIYCVIRDVCYVSNKISVCFCLFFCVIVFVLPGLVWSGCWCCRCRCYCVAVTQAWPEPVFASTRTAIRRATTPSWRPYSAASGKRFKSPRNLIKRFRAAIKWNLSACSTTWPRWLSFCQYPFHSSIFPGSLQLKNSSYTLQTVRKSSWKIPSIFRKIPS